MIEQLQIGERPPALAADLLRAIESARQACAEGPRGGFVAPARSPKKRAKKAAADQARLWTGEPEAEAPKAEGPKLTPIQAALQAKRRPCPELPRQLVRAPLASRERVYVDSDERRIAVRVEVEGGALYFARILDGQLGGLQPPEAEALAMIAAGFPEASGHAWRGCVYAGPGDARHVVDEWIAAQSRRLEDLRRPQLEAEAGEQRKSFFIHGNYPAGLSGERRRTARARGPACQLRERER